LARFQLGITRVPHQHTVIQIYQVLDVAMNIMSIGQYSVMIPGLASDQVRQNPDTQLVTTIGFGRMFWLFAWHGMQPRHMQDFEEWQGEEGRILPATEGDLAVVLSSNRKDCVMDLAGQVERQLQGMVVKVDEVHSVAATECDAGAAELPEELFIDSAEPDFTGGCFLFTQRYRFERPATPGIHFQKAVQLSGRQNEMLVHGLPYAGEQEQGEMLTVYMRDPSVLESVFQRMVMDPPADPARHWLQDCPAVSGTLFFVPSLDVLTGLRMGGIRMNRFSATQQFK